MATPDGQVTVGLGPGLGRALREHAARIGAPAAYVVRRALAAYLGTDHDGRPQDEPGSPEEWAAQIHERYKRLH